MASASYLIDGEQCIFRPSLWHGGIIRHVDACNQNGGLLCGKGWTVLFTHALEHFE